MRFFNCGKESRIFMSIPSFAPDISHCNLGTNTKSAQLGPNKKKKNEILNHVADMIHQKDGTNSNRNNKLVY